MVSELTEEPVTGRWCMESKWIGCKVNGFPFTADIGMPNKHNTPRRHHIPKMKFGVKNWAKYEAGLKQRGSLTLWITPEAIAQWRAVKRTTRGAQAIYSDLSIETSADAGAECNTVIELKSGQHAA